jgi:hypothetical protein
MPKNIEDMIVPEKRRSIRDIPLPDGRRKTDSRSVKTSNGESKTLSKKKVVEAEGSSLPPARTPIPRHRRGSRKKFWTTVGVVLVVAIFGLLSIFDGATLSYAPKSAALNFESETYTAHKSGTGGLFYSVVKLSREKGMTAPAGTEEEVSRKASGVIVVYNNSTESQRLVENTRFESPTGKIYRIASAITVPAKKTVSGTAQPGSVEATAYADVAGEEYNTAPTDFTVPGLKGTSRYSLIYARSKTPISGGFVGREKVVKPADLAKTKSELQATLKEELYQEAEAEVPEDFILFRSLSTFSFEDMPQTSANSGSITVNQRGHLYGVMFKRSDLSSFLAQRKLNVPAGDLVDVTSFASLNISFASTPPADLLPLNEINFKIDGSSQLVWITDEVSLRADLAGRHKRDVPGILNNYPTIASASVTVRPFWKSSLPSEPEEIKINKLEVQ